MGYIQKQLKQLHEPNNHVQKYKNYVEMFGYTEKTGIDLPGEGSGIFNPAASAVGFN